MNENELVWENDEYDSKLEDFYSEFMKENELDLMRQFIENADLEQEFKSFVDDEFKDYYFEVKNDY